MVVVDINNLSLPHHWEEFQVLSVARSNAFVEEFIHHHIKVSFSANPKEQKHFLMFKHSNFSMAELVKDFMRKRVDVYSKSFIQKQVVVSIEKYVKLYICFFVLLVFCIGVFFTAKFMDISYLLQHWFLWFTFLAISARLPYLAFLKFVAGSIMVACPHVFIKKKKVLYLSKIHKPWSVT